MVISIIIICFVIILILVIIVTYNISYYNVLVKDNWCNAPIILTILLALSLVSLTTAVFANYKDNLNVIPIYFLILFFEFLLPIAYSKKMFLKSIIISTVIFILTAFGTIFLVKGKHKEMSFLTFPFLFFSLVQLAISDNIYTNNFDNSELLNIPL